MKIVGGVARGRKLLSPGKGSGRLVIRPTSARAREAVFNILGPLVKDAAVLDLFAGTGAMGLEALSRGARLAVFVDRTRQAIELILRNIRLCGFSDRSTVVRRDLAKDFLFLQELRPANGFELVFIDPPYRLELGGLVLTGLAALKMVHPGGWIIVEHGFKDALPELVGDLALFDRRRYGEAGFWFYKRQETD